MKNFLSVFLASVFLLSCYFCIKGIKENQKIDDKRVCVVIDKKDVIDGTEHKGNVTYKTKHTLTVKYTKANGNWSEKYEDIFVTDNTYYTTNVGDTISFDLRPMDYPCNFGDIIFVAIIGVIALIILFVSHSTND